MKLQAKAFLFMIALTGVFFAIYFTLSFVEKEKTEEILRERRIEELNSFNRTIQIFSRALEIFSKDYTVWDDMVNFVKSEDKEWAVLNIEEPLKTFKANAAWVLNDKYELVYSVNNLSNKLLNNFPLSIHEVKDIMDKRPLSNFFIMIDRDLYEIFYAPIQPTSDLERKTKPKGFFFVSKQWNKNVINDLSIQSGSVVKLEELKSDKSELSQQTGFSISIKKVLNGWDDKPVIDLVSTSDFKMLKKSSESYNLQMTVLLVFSILILLNIYFFLSRYIVKPINLISRVLEEQNPAALRNLAKKKDEFGRLSQLIINFFSQKLQLLVEIQQRKDAELSLGKNEEFYKRIFENIQDIYYKIDLNGILTFVSPSVEIITGYKPMEVIGKKVHEYCTNPELWGKALVMLEDNKKLENFEFGLITKSNNIILCSANIQVLYDSSQRAEGYEGFIRDITKHKKKEGKI